MRIMVADRQSKVRFALRTLLRRQTGLEIVGEADTGEELLARVEATCPDLVLLHWRLSGGGSDLVPALRRIHPGLRVIVLSARPEACGEAMLAGADAFVSKMDNPDKLLAAIAAIRSDDGQRPPRGPGLAAGPAKSAAA
ncbi:MAG: response regulator transcription factor [Anaerolineae bacterium]